MHRNKCKKTLFVIPSLVVGGAERLMLYLLQNISREKFEIALCLFQRKGFFLSDVPHDIRIFDLEKKNRWDVLELIHKLNSIVKSYQPNLIYTRLWYSTLVATASRKRFGFDIPIIANEEHNHKRDISLDDPFGPLKRLCINWSHKKADLIIVPSYGVKKEIGKSYGVPNPKIQVIYNSVDLAFVAESVKENIRWPFKGKVIVSLGRLILRKGYIDLVKAFRMVLRESPNSSLLLIGEGEQKSELAQLATEMGIRDKLSFLGFHPNPFGFLSKADVFVLSSYWEGFANVIIEAMACGVPVVSTQCPFGPDEIMTNGVNGLLIPVGDVDAMAAAILKLFKDEPLRKKLAEAGKKRAEDFRVEKMVREYEKVFDEACR